MLLMHYRKDLGPESRDGAFTAAVADTAAPSFSIVPARSRASARVPQRTRQRPGWGYRFGGFHAHHTEGSGVHILPAWRAAVRSPPPKRRRPRDVATPAAPEVKQIVKASYARRARAAMAPRP
jgi:hypothetical protein